MQQLVFARDGMIYCSIFFFYIFWPMWSSALRCNHGSLGVLALEKGSPPGSRSFEADGRKQQIMLIREEVHAVLFRMRNAPMPHADWNSNIYSWKNARGNFYRRLFIFKLRDLDLSCRRDLRSGRVIVHPAPRNNEWFFSRNPARASQIPRWLLI